MMRLTFVGFGLALILSGAALSQNPSRPPAFGGADIHASTARALAVTGPFIGGGSYRLRYATMVDLIAMAYGVEADKIAGGPAWLEFDRFDISAQVPPGTSAATMKVMLQTLLADRFKLAVHNGDAPVTVYGLKSTAKSLLKPADGSGGSGCKTQPIPGSFQITNGSVSYACRNMTMEAFAQAIPGMVGTFNMNGYRVVDQTKLEDSWSFDITFRRSGSAVPAGEEPLYFFDTLPKQLGLEISLTKATLPALVVDSVNQKPTDNAANIAEILPQLPTAFEVADIKLTPPETRGYSTQLQPGGRIRFIGTPLAVLIRQAWGLRVDMLSGPKFLDSERFEIVAQIPQFERTDPTGAAVRSQDLDLINPMLRSLLTERFKMTFHQEDRPVTTYLLKAAKPRLQKADPSNRTSCLRGAGTGVSAGRTPTVVNTVSLTCRNMTMAQFARFLELFPQTNLSAAPIFDGTELPGAWDFTLAYSPEAARAATNGEPGAETPVASTPTGRTTLFDALEDQLGLKLEVAKRPGKVLVIDHIEQKPLAN